MTRFTLTLTSLLVATSAATAFAGHHGHHAHQHHYHAPAYTTIYCVQYRAPHSPHWALYAEFPSLHQANEIGLYLIRNRFETQIVPKQVAVGYVCRGYVIHRHHRKHHHHGRHNQHHAGQHHLGSKIGGAILKHVQKKIQGKQQQGGFRTNGGGGNRSGRFSFGKR